MASLIASGTTEASAEFTVTAGTPVTIFLWDANGDAVPADARATLQLKSSGATYTTVSTMDSNNPARVIDGPGTYKLTKYASTVAFGVDKE
jgi:hypothetical protein